MAKDLLAVWEEITIEYPFFSAYIFSCLIQLHSFVYAYVFANNPYCFIECYVGNFTCKVVRLIIFNNPFNDRRQWNFRPCVAFLWHIGQSFACSYMDNMFMYLGYFAKKAAFNVVFMISCSLRSICSLDGLLASVWLLFSWVFLSNSVLFVIMSIKPFFFHFF